MASDPDLYLGLISGTSADGIDAVLVDFSAGVRLIAGHTFPYADDLRQRLLALMHAESVALEDLGQVDVEVGRAFATAAMALLEQHGVSPQRVRAIGSHGQTIRHRPWLRFPFTLQIGDPHQIAEISGIRTVADFRRRDMAAGGQGAPLVCALHAALFAFADQSRAVLNLGGIANLTLLQPGQPVRGFDTGPANCLMDIWAGLHHGQQRDEAGAWAGAGQVNAELLQRLLDDEYFARSIPKSTGREHFHRSWLQQVLDQHPALPAPPTPVDVQATLAELSAVSIAQALSREAPDTQRVIACGGGVHNRTLMLRLQRALHRHLAAECVLETTAEHGLDPDFVEATAFAWMARETLHARPGNCAAVTGAAGPRVLGAICG